MRTEPTIFPGDDHSFIGQAPEATRSATRAALARSVDVFDRAIGDRAGR